MFSVYDVVELKITTKMQLLISFVVWILLVLDLNFKLFTSVNHHAVNSSFQPFVCVLQVCLLIQMQ